LLQLILRQNFGELFVHVLLQGFDHFLLGIAQLERILHRGGHDLSGLNAASHAGSTGEARSAALTARSALTSRSAGRLPFAALAWSSAARTLSAAGRGLSGRSGEQRRSCRREEEESRDRSHGRDPEWVK
jgi:hypothetical protein